MQQDLEQTFTHIFTGRGWGDGISTSRSGQGSNLNYTEQIIKPLAQLVKDLNLTSLLDAPCGDMTWMPRVLALCPSLNYIGADIAGPLVEEVAERYKDNTNWQFQQLDITSDPLPKVDLFFSRDCWFHLDNANIRRTIENYLASGIPWLMTTTHKRDAVNYDGRYYSQTGNLEVNHNGGFRLLCLYDAPWHFPEPTTRIEDTWGGHPSRELSLWTRDQVLAAQKNW